MKGIAHATGNRIVIASAWLHDHPDDFGMVVHELTHLIQRYPSYEASWLVEGIADYVRFWVFEPDAPRPVVNPSQNKYTDGYRVTAAFLARIVETHGVGVITGLNRALREGTYDASVFEELTGKGLDPLWAEYLSALKARSSTEASAEPR